MGRYMQRRKVYRPGRAVKPPVPIIDSQSSGPAVGAFMPRDLVHGQNATLGIDEVPLTYECYLPMGQYNWKNNIQAGQQAGFLDDGTGIVTKENLKAGFFVRAQPVPAKSVYVVDMVRVTLYTAAGFPIRSESQLGADFEFYSVTGALVITATGAPRLTISLPMKQAMQSWLEHASRPLIVFRAGETPGVYYNYLTDRFCSLGGVGVVISGYTRTADAYQTTKAPPTRPRGL